MFLHFRFSFYATVAFDAELLQKDPTRMANIENALQDLINEVHYSRTTAQKFRSAPRAGRRGTTARSSG